MANTRFMELKTVASTFGAYLNAAGLVNGTYALGAGGIAASRRDPFVALGKPIDRREHLSRQQAAIAVCIYRALLTRMDRTQALAAMAPLIEAGALAFLMKTLPDVSADALESGSPETRRGRVQAWMDRFFTARSEVTEVTETKVILHVTACSLVRLVVAAGHPELAPLFCKGDLTFFQKRGIKLERPTRIATGDDHCRFELQRS